MAVVAEGVETEGQRNLLAELGCEFVQGHLYAPAMSPEAFERWLIDHVAEQARAMLRSVAESCAQPTPSLLVASTGGLPSEPTKNVGGGNAALPPAFPTPRTRRAPDCSPG